MSPGVGSGGAGGGLERPLLGRLCLKPNELKDFHLACRKPSEGGEQKQNH